MVIKVYVNWCREEICSESGKEEKLLEMAEDCRTDSDVLENFLEDEEELSRAEIFNQTEEQKADTAGRFDLYCRQQAEEEFEENWSEIELEV